MNDREIPKLNTQVNIARPTAARMWLIFCCAFAAVAQSAMSDTGASLAVAIAALVSAVLAELLMTSTVHGLAKIKDGSAAASAMILALLLPNQINPVYAALGAAFAMVVIKHSFGGLGSNWMNPALGGWLFINLSLPGIFNQTIGAAAEYLPQPGSAADQAVREWLNKGLGVLFGTQLPAGYIDLFALGTPGIIADRAVLVLVISTAIIGAFEISHSWLSVLYLGIFGLLVKLLGNGDVILALCTGGTLVTAFILIVDPASSAKSTTGKIIMAALAAVLSFVFRTYAMSFYGCLFAAALVNALTPCLSQMERHLLYSHSTTGKLSSVGGIAQGRHK